MHIKDIIIEGFKSYRDKTHITGFDRHFNAITGFNGSGKSNIFDAICFLLGISTLSQVRASNLSDLIYKKGNAGINKASVTIIFDNKDKDSSPLTYEEYDEIIVSRTILQGKSKYYLNGYSATQDTIKNLFLSVQLNINNPHFLIMQGKVRQVVHMKPIEILGLLEEAAGTSIYQMKKDSSLKMIKKKENKLEEITKLLNEEISPQLAQLMKDKQNYLRWKNVEDEIFKIKKVLHAFDYFNWSNNLNEKSNEIVQYKNQRDNLQSDLNKILIEIEEIEKKLKNLEEKYKINFDNSIKDLEKKVNEEKTNIIAKNKKIEILKKNYKNCENEINKNNNKNIVLNNEIKNLEKNKEDLISNMNLFETEFKNSKEFLKELEINLENFKNGKEENISMLNINKLIIEAENNKNKSNFEKKNLLNQINFISEENKQKKLKLNEIETKKKTNEKKNNNNKKQINEQEKNLQNLQTQNNNLSTNTEKIERIRNIIKNNEDDLINYERSQQEILTRFASRLEINFRDPEPNFDRSKVSGRIIRNIQLKNPKYAKAIEQVAGGKLYNIIVDNENTSSILLNRKCFDYGVVLIPLTKINPKIISIEKKKLIENSVNNEAHLALDLIEFNPEFQKAMEFVFGNTFVCNTSEIARKLAYNEKFKVRCVNLDGDEFDPSGIMRGGAVNKSESILKKVDDLNIIQNKIKGIKNNIINNKNEIKNYEIYLKEFNEIKIKINNLNNEIKEFDKDLIEQNIIEINNDIKKNEEEINRCQKRIEELNNFEKKFNDDLIRLKKEKKDFENIDSSKKEENYKIKINQTKINIKEYEKKINSIKKKINDIDYNINQNKNNINDNEENIKNDKETIENLKTEINDLNEEIEKITNEYKKLDANLYEKKSELTKNENELNEIRKQRQINIDRKDQFNSDLKSLDIKIKQHENHIEESKKQIKMLENDYEWIKTEKDFFGIKETNYDFSKYKIPDLINKAKKLEDDNEILKRKVNMKVEVMADQYEKEYNELIKKKEIILKDKLNIEKAIKEMDLKRKESLNEIYEQVNKNLNSIYSTLLPQTKAKLEQVKKDNLMDGLQLRVAFNGIWKKSLSELSGGQSSLLALSLILALLLYKPAPIYIFDEIDAALDLSHTANLGLMLREHFPQSQFIVVSLKDGMFNNANVLYKVSYADGSSRVERITKNQL